MPDQLPDGASDVARLRSKLVPARRVTPDELLRRSAARAAWCARPTARMQYDAHADVLVVDLIPAPPVTARVVGRYLCIEFDGDDTEALPPGICLTRASARPNSAAARCAAHVLGTTIWARAEELVRSGDGECDFLLENAVRESRLRIWRNLTGLAIGVEIKPGALHAALVGAAGDLVTATDAELPSENARQVAKAIVRLVARLRTEQRVAICDSPIVLGVHVAGPVDSASGTVHHFGKRTKDGRSLWKWTDLPLGDRLTEAGDDLPTVVLNDVAAFATYECWTNPSDHPIRAVLLIDEGIGAKLIIDGRVNLRMPMEIGNIVLHEGESAQPCDCGAEGCLEATAGTTVIVKRIGEIAGRPVANISEAIRMAEPGGGPVDERLLDGFRDAGRDLARVIGHVQAIVNPATWIIYGPELLFEKGSAAGDAFLEHLYSYGRYVAFSPYKQCEVERRPIEGDEGAQGAAMAAMERFGIVQRGGPRKSDRP